ncbi:MAG: sortase [Lachnospiraceae bacterium]|nr:sortase [Lachnospiraceae bacterium]
MMTIGTVLVLAALALFVYNSWDAWRAGKAVMEIQAKLDDTDTAAGVSSTAEENSGAGDETDENESADTEMAVVEIDGYDYIGTLSISRFGLELPVMAQWSYAGLKIAPGRYEGSVWSDDLVICGHNYERHFGNLKNLEAGDVLTFTDVNGDVFSYEVREVTTLQPTDVAEMLNGAGEAWDLTLFTCTLGGQARVAVRCSRTDEQTEG